MKIRNLKVRTPTIPSRTAACQFIDKHGYDMEWLPEQRLFYIHDLEKDNLHCVSMDEVVTFIVDPQDNAAFMRNLRNENLAPEVYPPTKRGPGRPRLSETTSP